MTMALKMTMKDVNVSNVEDHNRIKAKELTATMTMTARARARAKPNNVDHRDNNEDVIDIDDDDDDDNNKNNNNVDNHFIDVNYGNKMMIAMTRKYRWVQCRESQKFRNGKRLFPFSNRANTRQTKVVSIAVNLLCKQYSQPTNESFCQ